MNSTDDNKIKIFVIGGGVNSAVGLAHISALALSPVAVIAGACFSRNQEANRLSADQFGIDAQKLFRSSQEMIDSVEAGSGIFVVLTDTPSHFEITKQLIQRGHHIIVEKAHAVTTAEGAEISSLLLENGIFYRCVFNYLGFNVLRAMKRLIGEGLIGTVLRCDGSMPQDSYLRLNGKDEFEAPQNWRRKDQLISTVSLDLGVHVVSAMRYVANIEIDEVAALAGPTSRVPSVCSGYTALYHDNRNKIIGLIDYGKYNFGHRNGLAINVGGADGSLEWRLQSPDDLLYTDSNGNRRCIDKYDHLLAGKDELRLERFKVGHPTGFVEALANLYSLFFEDYSLSKNETSFCSIEEANGILEAIVKIEKTLLNAF